jgi:two-component system NarL family sensor kinase
LNSSGHSLAGRFSAASSPGSPSLRSDAQAIQIRAGHPGVVLLELECLLRERLGRLQAVEFRLSRLVSLRRGRAGRRAVRQIERERRRLARELHTGVGQLLAAIRIQLEIIGGILPGPPTGVTAALDRIGALAADALDQVRAVSQRLHPPAWQGLPLHEALRYLWDISGVPHRFAASFDAPPLPRDPNPDVKTLLYRAAQEALSNVMRHAQATRVGLRLAGDAARIQLTVSDDGIGFNPRSLTAPAAPGVGIGLRSIREQTGDLGGKLLIHSGPLGTKLEISVPLES